MASISDEAARWAEIIRHYLQSGITQPQFCRENDLSLAPQSPLMAAPAQGEEVAGSPP